jgi:hypothetical protein
MTAVRPGGVEPRKRCSVCGERTARRYHWWLEETPVRFICDVCLRRAPLPTEEVSPTFSGADLVDLPKTFDLDEAA